MSMGKLTKITISLDDEVVQYAKSYAASHNGVKYQSFLRDILLNLIRTEKSKEKNVITENRDEQQT